jgi:hypothetical protein
VNLVALRASQSQSSTVPLLPGWLFKHLNGEALEGDIGVSITLYPGTKRRADLDNFNKLPLDACLDDSQIVNLKSSAPKTGPGIEVELARPGTLRLLPPADVRTATVCPQCQRWRAVR